MKNKYNYFKDPRALAEIRKHKWIESQKKGAEVGFATAAVDWIKSYGEDWEKMHVYEDNSIFIEKRKYRRFNKKFSFEAMKNNVRFLVKNINLSFLGVFFRTTKYLSVGSKLCVSFASKGSDKDVINCYGVIERACEVNRRQYEVFLKFSEHSQQEIQQWQYVRDSGN